MPRIQIPSSTIGQGAILNRGGTSQSSLSYLRGTVTYPNITSPYTIQGSFNYPNYYFYIYVSSNNSSYGSVNITYPWSESSTGAVGTTKQVFTGVYSYITISASPVYGRSFSYWSQSYPGGPVISYSNSYNVSYNGSYYDSSIYANFV
jgi:hypothetical protein